MVTMFTAGSPQMSPRSLARRGLPVLVLLLFVVVQTTAVVHELQHVLHLHDGPCGLHVAADHLAMAPAPEPALTVAPAPATEPFSSAPDAPRPGPARLTAARAPPSFA
jgi:hypothetical protein